MTFLNFLINGISLGSIYAIIALGYTMVYGIAKMLNFAHGDVIMVGAYVCFYAISSFNLPPLVGILLAMLVCTLLGMLIERLAYKPLRSAPSLAVLITAIGVSYFLQNAALLLWSPNPKVFPSIFGKGRLSLFGGKLAIPYKDDAKVELNFLSAKKNRCFFTFSFCGAPKSTSGTPEHPARRHTPTP